MSYRGGRDDDDVMSKVTELQQKASASWKTLGTAGAFGLGAVGVGLWALSRFRTASANQILVRSGLLVPKDGIQVGRQFVRWPFQYVDAIPLEPQSHPIQLSAMSKEKMPFNFPGVFTIGPKNDTEAIKRYAMRMHRQLPEERNSIIHGIIEGEARSLAAGLEMEDIFQGRTQFKDSIVASIQEPLDRIGLEVVNANLRELTDAEGSNYFRELAKRIQAQATNKAKVEVAEQDKEGTIGEKERTRDTRSRVAELEANATLAENTRYEEILRSKAQLEKTRAEQDLIAKAAKIDTSAQADILSAQKQRAIQAELIETETERQRAERLSKMRVDAETLVRKTEGDALAAIKRVEAEAANIKTEADARLHKAQREADAVKAKFEAEALGSLAVAQAKAKGDKAQFEVQAEGNFLIAQAKAKGIEAELLAQAKGQRELLAAQAEGFEKLREIMGSDGGSNLLQYVAIERGVVKDVARAQADAVKDMHPNLTVWAPTGSAAVDAVRSFVPTMETIRQQTGYAPPEWLVKKAETDS